MSLSTRYSIIDKAILITTGNTLVICGDSSAPLVNTSDLIDSNGDTTRDYTLSSSTANLDLLDGNKVIYAELIWYSTVKSSDPSAIDYRTIQDNPITLNTPTGEVTVTPTNVETYMVNNSYNRFRSAEVTSIIKYSQSGDYTVSNVPTSIPPTGLSDTTAGWVLAVIYKHESFIPKRIELVTGVQYITNTNPYQKAIIGFSTTSDEYSKCGKLLLAAANESPITTGDKVKAGQSFANLVTLGNEVGVGNPNPSTSPNNPYDNFFASQINLCDELDENFGFIDANGTLGTYNHNAFLPTQIVGARNKLDLAGVSLSDSLHPQQDQLAIQIDTSNPISNIQLLALGSMICVEAPDIVTEFSILDADGGHIDHIAVGERLVYSLKIRNTGTTIANNVTLSTVIDSNCTFIPESFRVNGVFIPNADIESGVNIGSIVATGVETVIFAVRVNSLPPSRKVVADMDYNYQFRSGSASPIYTNYETTESSEIEIVNSQLSVNKECSLTSAYVDDVLTYTITITNTGTEEIKDIKFQDIVSPYCYFNEASVYINNQNFVDLNPNDGFLIPNMISEETTEVRFDVTVYDIPPSEYVNNSAAITYTFVYTEYLTESIKTIYTNTTSTRINFYEIIGERCLDNEHPNVGDTVKCTLRLTNIGNITSDDVTVREPVIPGTTFVDGSVTIDDTPYIDYNPYTGFQIPGIAAKQTTVVTYDLLINEIPPSRLVENIAHVPFKYQISPQSPIVDVTVDSNKVVTRTNYVEIESLEKVDKAYATVGNTLFYTVEFTNTGNIDAFNTFFQSVIEPSTEFIEDSVTISGLVRPNYNPNVGFSIDVICPGETVTVTFKAKVVDVPTPNIVQNNSNLTYDYQPDPEGVHITETENTNIVSTEINVMSFTNIKTVDRSYATVGDPLVYKTTINNTGTVALKDVYFLDNIISYLDFYQGTVYVSGVNYPQYNPSQGFNIGDILPDTSVDIVFAATVSSLPPSGFVTNHSVSTYTYQVNPTAPIVTDSRDSNEVVTNVIKGEITATKYVNSDYAKVSDVLTYTVNISNTGNVITNNIYFTDIIPTGALFVANSVSINNIPKNDYNPNIGFYLEPLSPGQVTVVKFLANVVNVPVPNTLINSANVDYEYSIVPSQQPITDEAQSNSVTTIVNQSSSVITKSVDKANAILDDILTYTIVIENTGTVALTSLQFTDIVPVGSTFNAGSVYVNDVNYPDANPNESFTIGTLEASDTCLVSFKTTVTSIPNPAVLDNTATINYDYQLSPYAPIVNVTKTSNLVTTNIKTLIVNNQKYVSKQYATIDDVFTYTSVIQISGNLDITDVIFTDLVEQSVSFVDSTVRINNISYPSYNPHDGIPLGDISPNTPVTVTFDVKVDSLPANGYVLNTSNINYNYFVDPTQSPINENKHSNSVTTFINIGDLTITKNSSRSYARLNDIVTYTFNINNTGTVDLTNINLVDIIQSETLFQTDSVYINGTNVTGVDPNTGIPIPVIHAGEYAIVEFMVTVISVPPSGFITNDGEVTYSYKIDPEGQVTTESKTSNTTSIEVNAAIVSINKSVDKSIAKLNDTITYTITLQNHGNVSAQDVFFKDIVSNYLNFIENSVYVNSIQVTGVNPTTGFDIPDISDGNTTTVEFSANIVSRPPLNVIYNTATTDYKYEEQSGQPLVDVSISSNTTQTYVAVGELTVSKSVNKTIATLDDVLSYSVVIQNTGSVDATDITFTDGIQTGGIFIDDTVIINGANYPGYNPNTGFSLPNLLPSQSHTVTFNVNVNSVPPSNQIDNFADVEFSYNILSDPTQTETVSSNTVSTVIKYGELVVNKQVDKDYATLNETLLYTVLVTNTGNVDCSNISFYDIVDPYATFVEDSVYIDDVQQIGFNPNVGFAMPDILLGETATVKFNVVVDSRPDDGIIYNSATVNYEYDVDSSNPPISAQAVSQVVETIINIGELVLVKTVSKDYAVIDDILTYTIKLTNSGTVTNSAINFRDIIKDGGTFVEGSVKINSIPKPNYNPYESFPIQNLGAGETAVVTFNVRVISVPALGILDNVATATFTYYIDPNGDEFVEESTSNTVETHIINASLSMLKEVDKGYVVIGDTIIYTLTLHNTGNVDLTDVLFADNLQADISFVDGSVYIEGTNYPDYDPTQGFAIGTIPTLASVNLRFSVIVNSSSTHEAIFNYGIGTYSYKIDPDEISYTKSAESNTVSTIIVRFGMDIEKLVDVNYATLQDELNYEIHVRNTGTTTIFDLNFIDVLSEGGTFVNGTVLINDISYPDYNPIVGFPLDNIYSGDVAIIKFIAQVTSVPTDKIIYNSSSSNGSYKVDPEEESYPISADSNTVETTINVGNVNIVKSVNTEYAVLNDTLTYTSVLTNTGNIDSTMVWFFDTLQSDINFIEGTVRINGSPNHSLDPTEGFLVGTLSPMQTLTIDFQVKIISLPVPPAIINKSQVEFSYLVDPDGLTITKTNFSNNVITNVIEPVLNVAKSVDKTLATVYDTLTFTVQITNTGNTIAKDVMFYDTPSQGATFNEGSVTVNGASEPLFNPTQGFSLGDIGIGNAVVVTFTADVTTLPDTNTITNQATINFDYILDPQQPPISDTTYSNTTTTYVAKGDLSIVKSVNKQYATIGENLTYSIVITNVGNVEATNIVFIDPTPQNAMFVLSSVYINGVNYPSYNPAVGFALSNMQPSEIITVVYQVEVIS